MKILKVVAATIIKKSFNLSVSIIERVHDMTPWNQKLDALRQLPAGTLGNDIAKCLDDHNLRLVPNYESHDLKHVLLGFKMTPVDEIRMQAFMLGNGNYTIPCFAILAFGAMLLPDQWPTLWKDFRRGRNTQPIATWTIDEYAATKTEQLREMIDQTENSVQPIFTMKAVTKFGAFTSIFAGVAGMIFCLPFLFSSSLEDLVGAGFPFIGGAILAVGGLLALSNLSRPRMKEVYV